MDQGRVAQTLRAVSDGDASRAAAALLSGSVASDADAYSIQLALSVTNATASTLARAFKHAVQASGDLEAAKWLLVGLLWRESRPLAEPRLVWTAPGAPAAARGTAPVIRDHVRKAKLSVTVVGYSITSAADPFLRDLADAARRRVVVTIVADRLAEKLPVILGAWPADLPPPALWTRPADPADHMSALHAKVVVFDDRYLFISSANLTFHGLHRNLELGVLLEGPVAAEMSRLLKEWIAKRLVVPVR